MKYICWFVILFCIVFTAQLYAQELQPVVPAELRGQVDAEREGTHDANRIRTSFFNFGMVGDYPRDPINVDLTTFHSVEVPKGTGENYSDGITPFVLAKITQTTGLEAYIMETGFRERQGISPVHDRVMRFEPRPGYFQQDPGINKGRSIAMSNDPRTWPDEWINKLNDFDDPGWPGSWNGYFGKAPGADQESFTVYDDDFYDAWSYTPDSRDLSRRGLGLRIEQRGFQWANPQAGNVIFWHYDITNESTTDYNDNIVFGLYMDSGVGGSGVGRDGIPESDDDNAFFDKEAGLNLVYTWDKNGNGAVGKTGYLGYSYMETPGNPLDGIDNDENGVIDEKRDGGPGELIEGQENIAAWIMSNYDLDKFETFYSEIEKRPAYKQGFWWTGDEDMDWVAEFNDTGADGVFASDENEADTGELDGIPTNGEANFDKTDVDESDQIGLTGFKMNRIKAGSGSSSTDVDDIVFFTNEEKWPEELYKFFTEGIKFDEPLVLNYNIGFLFASGPFTLKAGKTERFSLALSFGKDLRELRNTTRIVQQIYKANYQFAVPPPLPTVNAFSGDGFVRITWNDKAERAYDPVSNSNDFEGYRIYRSTDPSFLDPQVITTGTGTGPIGNGKPIAQFDLINEYEGFTKTAVEGVGYFLGENTGIRHSWTDTTVTNGQLYYYAVTAYDTGTDSIEIYPSENAITVSQTLRGGIILPANVVEVRPNAPVRGYVTAKTGDIEHTSGKGIGTVEIQILNSELVPDNHNFEIQFSNPRDSIHAQNYSLIDVTDRDTLFITGSDFLGEASGPVGKGLLPNISTPEIIAIDTTNSGWNTQLTTNVDLKARVAQITGLPVTVRRPYFPDNLLVRFSDTIVDTSRAAVGLPAKPARYKIYAQTDSGDIALEFRFYDSDDSGTLSEMDDFIQVLAPVSFESTSLKQIWEFSLDTTGLGNQVLVGPGLGDEYLLALNVPFSSFDVFTFSTQGQIVAGNNADNGGTPYVVPNPYLGAASFEPQRFAVTGRGERRIEFRGLSEQAIVRIFTVTGELVQTLEHDGDITSGMVAWNMRSKDNLEVAPGLYIYHVEADGAKAFIGKFAILK